MSTVPEACINAPNEPDASNWVVEPVPVDTVKSYPFALSKSNTVVSAAARLMTTPKPLPETVRPSIPTTPTLPADALKLDH